MTKWEDSHLVNFLQLFHACVFNLCSSNLVKDDGITLKFWLINEYKKYYNIFNSIQKCCNCNFTTMNRINNIQRLKTRVNLVNCNIMQDYTKCLYFAEKQIVQSCVYHSINTYLHILKIIQLIPNLALTPNLLFPFCAIFPPPNWLKSIPLYNGTLNVKLMYGIIGLFSTQYAVSQLLPWFSHICRQRLVSTIGTVCHCTVLCSSYLSPPETKTTKNKVYVYFVIVSLGYQALCSVICTYQTVNC